jgi:alpha-glucosidase
MNEKRQARAVCLQRWQTLDDGRFALELDAGVAELSISADGSLRLRAEAGAVLASDPAPAIGREPWAPGAGKADETEDGGIRLIHPGPGFATLEVSANPFAVRVLDRRGICSAELCDLELDENGSTHISVTASPDERFFGFGEKYGGLDKRGQRLQMRNRDPQYSHQDPLYVSIPFFLGLSRASGESRSRGVLLDALGPSEFDVAAERGDRVRMSTESGGVDVTIFPGPRPADVLRRFSGRVGRCPLPPLWSLGHHQSRWSYRSEVEVRELAAEIRKRGIPTDAIHLDIDYMDGYRVFSWRAGRFPDPKAMNDDLRARGFRSVAIVDPGIKVDPEYPVYREGLDRDFFCRREDGEIQTLHVWPGRSALPDFNRAEVRDWWGEQHRALVDAGVSGIWNDMNEPSGWGQDLRLGRFRLPLRKANLSKMLQADPSDPKRTRAHEEVRNVYALQECRATREGLERARPSQRSFVLTRSGHAGIQRHAAVWTGDNRSRWADLRESIPMLLNLSLSGVPFCGADIGGFFGSCTPELYARWIQLGALYPFARTHSMVFTRRQEPWRFGRGVERIAREALRLRMRLLPYLYGIFRESEHCGAPVWRPLFYEFPDDPEAARVEDQILLGRSLMVAPVVERGAREREVYLPEGAWFSWHDDARYVGPRRIRVAAPLDHLPLFVRAGSIVPTQSPIEHVAQSPAEPCVLEVFPGGDATGELVEDDGETTEYRRGEVARSGLRLWDRRGDRLRVEIGPREGSYEIPERTLQVRVRACPTPELVHLDGQRLEHGNRIPGYHSGDGRLTVRISDHGEGAAIEIEPGP